MTASLRLQKTVRVQRSLYEECEPRKPPEKGPIAKSLEPYVVVPEEAPWLAAWDSLIVVFLFVTAYYEPYSVALVKQDPMWAIRLNRVLDVAFTADMLMNFVIAYQQPMESAEDALWVKDPGRIAARYLNWPLSHRGLGGFFWIDLASVLPGWCNLIQRGVLPGWLVLLRLLRLVRVAKLPRLHNLLFRWHQQYGFPFWCVEVGKLFLITSLTSHWLACGWVMVEGQKTDGKLSYTTEKATWLTAMTGAKGDSCTPSAEEDAFCVYAISLYWATMTLTTVGYGDITAQNPVEYIACTISMLVVAYVWAYVVGKMVTLLESLDPEWGRFKHTMDTLQTLMDSRGLPRELQVRLRKYLHASRGCWEQNAQRQQLKEHVTQSLQREVALCSAGIIGPIKKGVFWARDLEQDALLDLVRALEPITFGPGEIMMLPHALIFVRRGIAAVNGRILNRGDIWGQMEILLLTEALIESSFPRTLTQVDVLLLSRAHLLEVCSNFPHADKRLRRAQVRTAVFRAFIKAAKEMKELALAKELKEKANRRTSRMSCRMNPAEAQAAYAASAATSFVSPGRSTLHMMSKGLANTEETSLADLTLLLKGMNERHEAVEETMKTILANQATILARHLTS